jgi:two-component system chemotaxis sensor kinase CheA
MRIFPKLAVGFGVVVATLSVTGALVLSNLAVLRTTSDHVKDRVSFNEDALQYRHGAETATLGAAQLASGSPMGEQRIREGVAAMASSREQLKLRASGAEAVELAEIERLERLTVAATVRVENHVKAKSPHALVQQDLAFLSARSDALNLRLEALADDTREDTRSSMAMADQIGDSVKRQTAGAVLACVLFSILVALYVSRSISRPVAHLEEGVKRISSGELEHSITVTSSDEIGQLTKAFNDMTRGLRETMTALDNRNRDMRLVFDNVAQGLVTMNPDGTVSEERSAAVDNWLGEIPKGRTLWGHFEKFDNRFAANFKFAYESIIEDEWLPLELRLDNAPKKAKVGDRFLELEYRPILEGERVSKVLVITSDVSERIAQEKARAEEQETLAVFRSIQKDRDGFLDFLHEGQTLLDSLSVEGVDLVTLKRQVHTLKGNSGCYAITSVANACHDLETAMEDEGRGPTADEIDSLRARWDKLCSLVAQLVGEGESGMVVDAEEHAELVEAVLDGTERSTLASRLEQWKCERVSGRFERFGEQARSLATRLEKDVRIQIDCGRLRLNKERFGPFWSSFVHVVRNAVDHGIEPPHEREELGKTEPAKIVMRAYVDEEHLTIEVVDNGRGIAWEKIAEKAKERGMPAQTRADLVEALFSDGVSTAAEVTSVSGRGVGMAAVRDVCKELGGRITIESERGVGTRTVFRFPAELAQAIERRPLMESGSMPIRPAYRLSA